MFSPPILLFPSRNFRFKMQIWISTFNFQLKLKPKKKVEVEVEVDQLFNFFNFSTFNFNFFELWVNLTTLQHFIIFKFYRVYIHHFIKYNWLFQIFQIVFNLTYVAGEDDESLSLEKWFYRILFYFLVFYMVAYFCRFFCLRWDWCFVL